MAKAKKFRARRESNINASARKPTDTRSGVGEAYQSASAKAALLTTQQGVPVSDDQNSLRVGARGPTLLEERMLGVMVTGSAATKFLAALQQAVAKQGAVAEIIEPTIGGVKMSDNSWKEAHHTIAGGPSVLFDAVAVVTFKTTTEVLLRKPSARDFVANALLTSSS